MKHGYTGRKSSPGAATPLCRVREGVFSSTGFRIRAAQPTAATTRVARWAERAAASLFFTLFPADCRICGSPLLQVSRLPVCENCLGALRGLSEGRCDVCGEAFGADLQRPADAVAVRCRTCRQAPPPFERAVAYGSYDGALRDLIHLLKFHQVRPAGPVLGRMIAESIAVLEPAVPPGTIAIVPVPLHTNKKSQRGFNQAELIARAALKQLSRSHVLQTRHSSSQMAGQDRQPVVVEERFALFADALVRTRDTASQIGLTRHQRREHLRGAFAVKDQTPICNRDVLLVDDVYTTGATASECARVLRRAGAARVWVATVARTLRVFTPAVEMENLSQEEGREQNEESESRLSTAVNG